MVRDTAHTDAVTSRNGALCRECPEVPEEALRVIAPA